MIIRLCVYTFLSLSRSCSISLAGFRARLCPRTTLYCKLAKHLQVIYNVRREGARAL